MMREAQRPTAKQRAGRSEEMPVRSCLGRWVIVVGACGALRLATTPAVALPGPWKPGALADRVASDGAFVGTVALAHQAVTWVGWYVAALVTIAIVVRIGGSLLPRRAATASTVLRFLDHVSFPGTRSLLAWSIGLASLAGPTVAASAAFAAGGSHPPEVVATSAGRTSGGEEAAPVMSLLPATPRTPPARTTRPTSAAPALAPPETPPPAPAPPADVAPTMTTWGTWVVQPGDHLWSISERTLAAASSTPPGLERLGPYWWRVVTANRATLPNPADIDLLFPGDVVTLPPLPPSS
jgi:nucleoid-associated protein YgaU